MFSYQSFRRVSASLFDRSRIAHAQRDLSGCLCSLRARRNDAAARFSHKFRCSGDVGDSWVAFFCSNRNTNQGCGRTTSALRHEIIPHCMVRTDELYQFLRLLVASGVVASAWRDAQLAGSFSLSKSSAYRWCNRFSCRIHHYRSKLLLQVHPPPEEKWIASPNPEIAATMEMFDEAKNKKTVDPFSAFQLYHQVAF